MDLEELSDHCLNCKNCHNFREKIHKQVLEHIAKTENHPSECYDCKQFSARVYFYITVHIKWENFRKHFLWG